MPCFTVGIQLSWVPGSRRNNSLYFFADKEVVSDFHRFISSWGVSNRLMKETRLIGRISISGVQSVLILFGFDLEKEPFHVPAFTSMRSPSEVLWRIDYFEV